jgi:phage tail-like protein
MAVIRERPYPSFNFLVDLGTGDTESVKAGFEEVIFPEVYLDVMEYRNGNEKENAVRKITGLEHSTNLILKRGVIGSLDLYEWYNQVRNGDQSDLRTIVIQLQSEDHTSVVLTWKFLRSRPVKMRFSNLDATSKDVLMEYLEIAFERLEME